MSNLPPNPPGTPPPNIAPPPPPLLLNYPTPAPLNYAPPARNDLRQIAVRQKAIMYCILGYIGFFILLFVLPEEFRLVAGLGVIAAAITGAVFVFMLAVAVYNTGMGIFLGALTLIPYIGIIGLLTVNMKATAILRANGIRVGMMGADPRQIPQAGIIN